MASNLLNVPVSRSMYEIKTSYHGKRLNDFHSLVAMHKKAHSFAALTRSGFLHASHLVNKTRIVRTFHGIISIYSVLCDCSSTVRDALMMRFQRNTDRSPCTRITPNRLLPQVKSNERELQSKKCYLILKSPSTKSQILPILRRAANRSLKSCALISTLKTINSSRKLSPLHVPLLVYLGKNSDRSDWVNQ